LASAHPAKTIGLNFEDQSQFHHEHTDVFMQSVLLLSDLNQNQKVTTNFSIKFKYEILRKSVWWEFLFHADVEIVSDVTKVVVAFGLLTRLKPGSDGKFICENNMGLIGLKTLRHNTLGVGRTDLYMQISHAILAHLYQSQFCTCPWDCLEQCALMKKWINEKKRENPYICIYIYIYIYLPTQTIGAHGNAEVNDSWQNLQLNKSFCSSPLIFYHSSDIVHNDKKTFH
jgi:hypothetical protein